MLQPLQWVLLLPVIWQVLDLSVQWGGPGDAVSLSIFQLPATTFSHTKSSMSHTNHWNKYFDRQLQQYAVNIHILYLPLPDSFCFSSFLSSRLSRHPFSFFSPSHQILHFLFPPHKPLHHHRRPPPPVLGSCSGIHWFVLDQSNRSQKDYLWTRPFPETWQPVKLDRNASAMDDNALVWLMWHITASNEPYMSRQSEHKHQTNITLVKIWVSQNTLQRVAINQYVRPAFYEWILNVYLKPSGVLTKPL